jgi:imidazolonepropionase-like amidohydrolase
VILKADRYLDVSAGRLVTPGIIVVVDRKISAINPASLPPADETVELPGLTLLPGLMDAHTHLGFDIVPGWETEDVRLTPADLALRGARNARKTLLAGFTTVRYLGERGFADVALARAVDQGWVDGPQIIPAGNFLSITGGHCDVTGFAPGVEPMGYGTGVADGPDNVLRATRYQIKHGAKVVKICATAGVLSFEGPVGTQQYTAEELRAAAQEAHRHGMKIAAHAHGTEGIIASSNAGIDSIEHASIMTDEAAEILRKNGTFVVPNLYLWTRTEQDKLPPAVKEKFAILSPQVAQSFRRDLAHKLKIAFGTDAGVFPHGENAKEFELHVANGQTPINAIRSATTVNAELFGLPDRGQIAAGLLADIIAVQGDPTSDISLLQDVKFVMKQGTTYKRP